MAYAEKTSVSPAKSRNEIEATLKRYGAEEFGFATRAGRAAIQFTLEGRQVLFEISLPDESDPAITRTATGKARTTAQREAALDQALRQRWRALFLVVKAKLEAVESGIVTFEQEFLAHVMLPGGGTVYSQAGPAIASAYETGAPTPLLQIGGA